MKIYKHLLYGMLLLAGTFTITSCFNDDEDENYTGLTQEDYTYYMNLMAGDYHGYLYFADESLSKLDSIATSVTVTGAGDSCIYVSVPIVSLVRGCTDSWVQDAAAEDDGNVTIAIKYYLYSNNNGDVYFGAYPQYKYGYSDSGKKTVSLTYQGETHEVDFYFYNNTNYNGEYYRNQLQAYFYLAGIQVDGVSESNITISSSYLSPEAYFRVLLSK